jgi:hypothetical protein
MAFPAQGALLPYATLIHAAKGSLWAPIYTIVKRLLPWKPCKSSMERVSERVPRRRQTNLALILDAKYGLRLTIATENRELRRQ